MIVLMIISLMTLIPSMLAYADEMEAPVPAEPGVSMEVSGEDPGMPEEESNLVESESSHIEQSESQEEQEASSSPEESSESEESSQPDESSKPEEEAKEKEPEEEKGEPAALVKPISGSEIALFATAIPVYNFSDLQTAVQNASTDIEITFYNNMVFTDIITVPAGKTIVLKSSGGDKVLSVDASMGQQEAFFS